MALVLTTLTVSPAAAGELEVVELVAAIKRAIGEAQKNAKPPAMTIPWIEAEVSYVVKQDGGAGLKMYVVTVEGKYATEAVQRIKYRLEPSGRLRVEDLGNGQRAIYGAIAGVDRANKIMFIASEGAWAFNSPSTFDSLAAFTLPITIKNDTSIVDRSGETRTIKDLKAGTAARILLTPAGGGYGFMVKEIVIGP